MPSPPSGFELREHTADLALYAWGASPETLFTAAAEGLYAAIGQLQPLTSASRVQPAAPAESEPGEITLTAPDRADLLGDFLAELLFLFETRHVRLADLRFHKLSDTHLRATGRLQAIDLAASQLDREVKAVTRHNLRIAAGQHPLETTVILDI